MDVDDDDILLSSNSTANVQKSKKPLSKCKVCDASAPHSNYGALSCESCKIFFRRNGKLGLETFKCVFDGHCDINILNRHTCTHCRLAKCFQSGMQTQMIRCPRTSQKKNVTTKATITVMNVNKQYETQLIPTVNILRSDQSRLTMDQWNLISNLVNCYEEHSAVPLVQHFMQEQNKLPLKLRFKSIAVSQLFGSILGGIQRFFGSNRDFLSLDSHDCPILLRSAMENAGTFGSVLVLRETKVFDHPSILKSVEDTYGTITVNLTQRLLHEVHFDITFVKLGIAMFAFSTTNCTIYTNTSLNNLKNIKEILHIQNMYAEVTWKYLLYKYDHLQAVIFFSNFIRCLLLVNAAIIQSHQSQHHTQIVENLVETIDHTLNINE